MLKMERISSRKNGYIAYLRQLASDGALRREGGETVLDGEKLLGEALASGCEVTSLLAAEGSLPGRVPEGARLYAAPPELVAYASPVKNSPGPVFTVRLPERRAPERVESAVVLESVQDPGNVGTVIRTANALGVDAVILAGDCADPLRSRDDGRGLPSEHCGGRPARPCAAARGLGPASLRRGPRGRRARYPLRGAFARSRRHRQRGPRPLAGAPGAMHGPGHYPHGPGKRIS